MITLNLVVAAAVIMVFWSFRPQMTAWELLAGFIFCAVFTNGFGLPVGWLLSRHGPTLDRLPTPQRWIVVTLEILFFTVLGTFLGQVILRAVGFARADRAWVDFWVGVRFSIVVALAVGLGVFAWTSLKDQLEKARRELVEREVAEAHTRELLAEARLAALEARIHPHFLFNTLNSIAALIPEDPRLAEETVQRLATLLRFTLDVGGDRLVPLGQELRVVRDYLEIEKARFGGRLRAVVEATPDSEALLVPPLAVQTLVENAVKHAVATRRDGAEVRVGARRVQEALEVAVADDGPGFDASDIREGRGLDNLRERLRTLYGERAGFEVRRRPGSGAEVRLRLPVETATNGRHEQS